MSWSDWREEICQQDDDPDVVEVEMAPVRSEGGLWNRVKAILRWFAGE